MRKIAQMDDAARCPHCSSRATSRKLSMFALVVSQSTRSRDDEGDTDLDMQYGDGHDHGDHDDDFDDDDY